MSIQNNVESWPHPDHDPDDQPHFLFLVTPPYSGSTAMAKMLDTSKKIMMLGERGEGQWLLPGLCETNRWVKEKYVDYAAVKAVWLKNYQNRKAIDSGIEVVVEKSPPNMVRIARLSSLFERFSLLANNRDPYAHCASIFYRRYHTDNQSQEQRCQVFEKLAAAWLMRSRIVRNLVISSNVPLLTYESFCDDVTRLLDLANLPAGVADTVDADPVVSVKDYAPQRISNQNPRQISKLSEQDIHIMEKVFKSDTELLSFFGYKLLI